MDYISFGDASELLQVPQPTLRGWCDKFEEIGVHYIVRNRRGERIFYQLDLDIYRYVNELKDEHGRSANYLFLESRVKEKFECRTNNPNTDVGFTEVNEVGDNQIQKLINNELFKATIQTVVRETATTLEANITQNLRGEIREEFTEQNKAIEERQNARMKQTDEWLGMMREIRGYQTLPFWKKLWVWLFGQKKVNDSQ
jgi:hypothetical protein